MSLPFEWVSTSECLLKAVSILSQESQIAFDCEFIRETTFFPKMALIQVATENKTWLIDPLSFSKQDLSPLLSLLESPKTLKIIHAAYADQECLFWAYGMVATPVLDTSIAASFCGCGDNVGLEKLLREFLQVRLPKGRARAKWLERPLSKQLQEYAALDVLHLVALGKTLIEKLKARGRLEWTMEESSISASLFDVPAVILAERIARSASLDAGTYSALIELVKWREERARKANLPRSWVADNDILLSLARSKPSGVEELRSFRGLKVSDVEKQGARILSAIQTGLDNPSKPEPPASHYSLSEREDHVLIFLRTYVSFLANEHKISPRFLIPSASLLPLIKSSVNEGREWVKSGFMSRHAFHLIGDEIQSVLDGQKGLILKNGRVERIQVKYE